MIFLDIHIWQRCRRATKNCVKNQIPGQVILGSTTISWYKKKADHRKTTDRIPELLMTDRNYYKGL